MRPSPSSKPSTGFFMQPGLLFFPTNGCFPWFWCLQVGAAAPSRRSFPLGFLAWGNLRGFVPRVGQRTNLPWGLGNVRPQRALEFRLAAAEPLIKDFNCCLYLLSGFPSSPRVTPDTPAWPCPHPGRGAGFVPGSPGRRSCPNKGPFHLQPSARLPALPRLQQLSESSGFIIFPE